MKLTNNTLYNLIKKNYYHYFAYRKLKPKWNEKEKRVTILLEGKEYSFMLEEEYNNGEFFKPLYLSSNLDFLKNELQGYFYKGLEENKEIVLDLGAYQGGFSLYVAKRFNGLKKAIMFEPDPKNILSIKKNYELNKLGMPQVIPTGIWKEKTTLLFDQAGATGHISKTGKLKIKVTDLDSELKRLKIPFEKISLIKMDIEGAEIEAIDGMKELLTRGSPHLAIASYHIRDGQKTYIEVERKLKALGYRVETGYPKHLTTWAWKPLRK